MTCDYPIIPTLQLVLLSTAWMLLWTQTNLPAHLFRLLKPLTPRLPWSESGYELKFRDEWFTWINVNLPAYWAELLSCQYCLGVHAACWAGLLIWLTPYYITQPLTAVSTAVVAQHLVMRGKHV